MIKLENEFIPNFCYHNKIQLRKLEFYENLTSFIRIVCATERWVAVDFSEFLPNERGQFPGTPLPQDRDVQLPLINYYQLLLIINIIII